MEKIFVTYGDSAFEKARNRIVREAKKLHFFDHIIAYTPDDLPLCVKKSPLMRYKKGGGYWCWKPWLIWYTLQKFGNDVVVFYADAGCTLQKSQMWKKYLDNLLSSDKDTMVFQYDPDIVYSWVHQGAMKNFRFTLRQWTKYNVIKAFDEKFTNRDWLDSPKILSGFIIAKNKDNKLISEWYNMMLYHPEYFSDSEEGEFNHPEFVEHRHDQIVLGILAYLNDEITIFKKQTIDGCDNIKDRPVIASRLRDLSFRGDLIRKTKKILHNFPLRHTIKTLIGSKTYFKIKNTIKNYR